MSGTELIMGMGEVINYLKELEAENKKLKRANELNAELHKTGEETIGELEAEVEELKEKLKLARANAALEFTVKLNQAVAELGDKYHKKLKEENQKLKEENKKLEEYSNEEREIMSKVIEGMKQEMKKLIELEDENKKLKEDMSAMKEELAEKFYKHYEDMGYNKLNIARTIGPNLGRMIEHLIKQNKELKEEQLTEENAIEYVYGNTDKYDDWVKGSTLYQELKEENKKLEMKGNARKDIIKNMFECITADLEEVQDGFTIKRDWGHKYIDEWNEIVSQEYKEALKDINEQLDGIEWETDGYQFDLNIVEEDSDDPDEE